MDELDVTTPDFSNSVDVVGTDSGEAISAISVPDFSNSSDVVDNPKPQRLSAISKIARFIVKQTPIEQFKTSLYLAKSDKIPQRIDGENWLDYGGRVNQSLQSREDEIVGEGIGKVLESPMQVGIGVGLATATIPTIAFLGVYSLVDKFINLRRYTEHNFPNTAPEVKDIIEIGDFLVKGGLIGKGVHSSSKVIRTGFDKLGIPKNVNISAEQVGKIKESVNLLPEEKVDLMTTLGIEQKHLDASVNSDIPLNVPSEKILDLAEKPYWERTKEELGIELKPEEIALTAPEIKAETPVSGTLPPELEPLAVEARKYKTAEEFKTAIADIANGKKTNKNLNNLLKNPTPEQKLAMDGFTQSNKGDVLEGIYTQATAPKEGGGIYHGTGKPIEKLSDLNYTTQNYYGQGFYTTDNLSIAEGYSKKGGKTPTIYKVTPNENVKLFDMESKLTPEIKAKITDALGDYSDALKTSKNLREVFDEVRDTATGDMLPADEIQGIYDSVRANFEDMGYGGYEHVGGLKTGKSPHKVRIYWNPESAVKLSPTGEGKVIPIDKQPILENIKKMQEAKDISGITLSKLKKFVGIDNIKQADVPQLQRLENYLSQLKKGDKFISEKTLAGLKDIVKELPSPEVTPKRIIVDKFGDKNEILGKGVVGKVVNELIPTVDIKEGHPLIKKIVEEARVKLDKARNEVDRRNEKLDKMLTKAEKSREGKLSTQEKISRKLLPQNKEIFEALGGNKVELTKDEVAVVAYLKNFFKMAKEDLVLEKSRKNYVTHIEQSLTEKILTKGVSGAIKQVLSEQKQGDLPIDIMLELDNIIGSEKFFRFALERKGGIEPSTNLRHIVNTYSNMYETKKVLDSILPEGQAVTKNLLQGKSALWMKNFLQNLKGRGLDNNFRTGKMGWLAKTADGIIDIGYIKLLGLNWKSALKNVVAGETNSWIWQDFPIYLEGKKRFSSNPKKAYNMAKENGILEGTYADYAEKGIGKLKKLQDFTMIGQKGGEFEIRSSIFASMLTEKEWKSGKIAPENLQKIKDTVSITQGVFSAVDSPLLLQTWYGRMFFQMNRWRITNTMLVRRITIDAAKDIKAGKYKTQNTSRLGKMLVAYGTGMYISNELRKAGYRKAGDVARNIAQTIDGVTSLVTEGDLVRMFTENPTLQTLKEVGNSIQDFAHYLHVPGAEKARGKGIEETYIAPVQGIEDIMKELQ